MSNKNESNNSINVTIPTNFNISRNISPIINDILISITNNSFPSSSSINQKTNSNSFLDSFKLFVESIPQSLLLMCILVLFILFFIVIIIIFICLIKKRKRLLQTETIVNNNKIDINKMILQNSNNLPPNIKDFHSVQNNSNVSDFCGGTQNMSLGEIKVKNLKEEIHSIVSGTLNDISNNKSRKMKRKKKGISSIANGQQSDKSENNNIITTKELDEDNKQQIKNDIII